jgi:hypothetical protein
MKKRKMKCNHCGRDVARQVLNTELGLVCSQCDEAECNERKDRLGGLALEPLNLAPAEMDVAAFERWALKLAVHVLKTLPATKRLRLAKMNPLAMYPEVLANQIKERILVCMPANLYRQRRLPWPGSFWAENEFWFPEKISFSIVVAAAAKAGFVR